ncbi:TonB-dependent receptor domain-containing protein [Methylophilus sp. TWE2]|uniref:TonB-dependent receptor domain-containing protein n=1 Tax=Methylophilus sp. TWE2 TaxID=1662285 RepID=UPI000670A1C6|nr:TonB-dependent receptor [Methylophilus sp. TWE2]AKR43066.1 TonB-dependent receptor [Methylophilus sp. TWE2]
MHTPKKLILGAAIAACFSSQPAWINPLWAAELNTNLPQSEEDALLSQKITINLPAQPLAASLKALSAKIGLNITYNDKLVSDKQAPALSGTMRSKEALQKLLANTGLEAKLNDNTLYIQRIPNISEEKSINIEKVEVRAKKFYEIGPLPGIGLSKDQIPGNVQSISAKEIKESHSLSITDLMNRKLQSVTVNDYQSNPFQMDLQYRGFTASPQLGTAQGISVFLDGIRVNEPFGDVVNWDMIPMNALSSLDMFPGSNPVFGLGTLGGALAMRTKSGFDGKSLDAEILTGSFGRKQLQASAGGNNDVIAGFVSGNFFLEDGWRKDSPSKVNQVFGKAEWQSDRARLGLSMLYAGNKLTGNGLLPQQMVDQNPKQVYTSPDESKNDLLQFQLSGVWDVTDTFNITSQIYNRKSKRKSHTSDVNENFGGDDDVAATASTRDRTRQLLPGLQDINRDGLPDYNDYTMNVAADANYNPLATFEDPVTGVISVGACLDPEDSCAERLIYGTDFGTRARYRDEQGQWQDVTDQVQVDATDGSGTKVWNWTFDPRIGNDFYGLGGNLAPSKIPDAFNAPVASEEYAKLVRFTWENRAAMKATNNLYGVSAGFLPRSSTQHAGAGNPNYDYDLAGLGAAGGVFGGYTDSSGFFHSYWELSEPINKGVYPELCAMTGIGAVGSSPCVKDANGNYIYRDGKASVLNNGVATGYIEGTPTAIFNDTEINQLGKGAAVQLNWNLDQHKLMIGSSFDTSDSTYASKQYLGFLDKNRHGYVDPSQLGWEYSANSPERGFALNDFKGDNTTKSIYFSETWTPTKTLSINAAARFNHTIVRNQLDVTKLSHFGDVNRIVNLLNYPVLCTDTNNNGTIEASDCPLGLDDAIVPFDPSYAYMGDGFIGSDGKNMLAMFTGEKEKFKYRSFNPSLGITWQAQENLNLYGNWSRGARTPTTIELGCAFDDSPVFDKIDSVTGQPVYVKRSWRERRSCNLPGAMSGDPYLKQVRSNSLEFGARGRLTDYLEWNASVYRTDLTDDIYFVAVNGVQSYFKNIGNTRRQGLEMGLKGRWGKTTFGINYGLTDATFQSEFTLDSPNNSSAGNVYDLNYDREGTYGQIKVKPGNRMPGVPLHNLNLNMAYELTSKWNIGLNMVMHSEAFIRGNENNKHKAGSALPIFPTGPNGPAVERAGFGPGKSSGYAVFNFQTSYKITPEWIFGLQVNNLFDKEYASAGRLGLNAFSPSIRGVIGESGFNYNSADWQGTSFLGIGAPRSAFVTLSYEFQPKKNLESVE